MASSSSSTSAAGLFAAASGDAVGPGFGSSASVDSQSAFFVHVTGSIVSGSIPGQESTYCRYFYRFGSSWEVLKGAAGPDGQPRTLDEGITQVADRAVDHASGSPNYVWNFPIEATFRSANIHGWPQLIVVAYRFDGIGRDVVFGYGWTHLPMAPGSHTKHIRLFRPASSSMLHAFVAWMTGNRPEFLDPTFCAQSSGREVVRTQSSGFIRADFSVQVRKLEDLGYQLPSFYSRDANHLVEEEHRDGSL